MSGGEQERLEAVIEVANDALVIIDERGVTDILAARAGRAHAV